VAAAAQLSVPPPVQSPEPTDGIGTVIIIGVTASAGSADQTADRIPYRTDIAGDRIWLSATRKEQCRAKGENDRHQRRK
jgi:hypothetical protein